MENLYCQRRDVTSFTRAASAIAVLLVIGLSSQPAMAQEPTAALTTVNSPVVLGRSSFALPPGDWKVIPTASTVTTTTGEAARREVGTFLAVQVNPENKKLKAVAYYVATLITSPNIANWNTTRCDPTNVLHKDTLNGNFKFPECLLIDYWITPDSTPTNAIYKKLWDWGELNGTKLPVTMLLAAYSKYRGGDYVLASYWLNPEEFGMNAAVERDRARNEWNAAGLKQDSKRSAYVEAFKKWGYVMGENTNASLVDRAPKQTVLPEFPAIR